MNMAKVKLVVVLILASVVCTSALAKAVKEQDARKKEANAKNFLDNLLKRLKEIERSEEKDSSNEGQVNKQTSVQHDEEELDSLSAEKTHDKGTQSSTKDLLKPIQKLNKPDEFVIETKDGEEVVYERNPYLEIGQDMDSILSENPKIPSQERDRRKFVSDTAKIWPNAEIPYSIDNNFQDKSKEAISWAIDQFHNKTCLKWNKVDEGYKVIFTNLQHHGCESYIGNAEGHTSERYQIINLKETLCIYNSIILHEMLHTAAVGHEQSRSDREKWIKVIWENVEGGQNNTAMKKAKNSTNFHVPFDYGSRVMYSLYANSNRRDAATLKLKHPYLDFLTETGHGLSFYDIMLITRAYKCADKCTISQMKMCKNGGFIDKNCKCLCPEGLTGTTCEDVITDDDCGGGIIEIKAINSFVNVRSPNYPAVYDLGKRCAWLIKGPTGCKLQLTVEDFNLANSNDKCKHWVGIGFNLIGQRKPSFCGKGLHSKTFTTMDYRHANIMMITMDTFQNRNARAEKGFNFTVKAIQGNDETMSVSSCEENPCKNGGTCHPYGYYDFRCECSESYIGNNCETEKVTTSNQDSEDFLCSENSEDACSQINKGNWKLEKGIFSVKATEGQKEILNIPYNMTEQINYCVSFSLRVCSGTFQLVRIQTYPIFPFLTPTQEIMLSLIHEDCEATENLEWKQEKISIYVGHFEKDNIFFKTSGDTDLKNIQIEKGTECSF